MAWLGIDTGGTFTDFVWFSAEDQEIRLVKVPSDPAHVADVCAEGLRRLGEDISGASRVVHGTTLITNTVLEGDGARVATLTTRGYRDLIEIGRQSRHQMYDLRTLAVRPLSPRKWRIEVAERTLSDGTIVEHPTPGSLTAVGEQLARLGVDAVAVCLLFSYLEPANELAVAEFLRQTDQWFVTASHEVVGQAREYERFSTTVMNAYVGPRANDYLDGFETFLNERRLPPERVFLIGTTGGAMTWRHARRSPVSMLNSGPAGGVRGAVALADHLGVRNIITYDMGGTSTEVCLIRDLEPAVTSEGLVAHRPFILPKLDIATIGAGGGSIAWFDLGGELQVGPRSAGATPGPACYARGGAEPTVTDADVVLGRISDGTVLGDTVRVRLDLAREAVARVASAFPGMSVTAAAEGIVRIAVAKMNTAMREVSVARGLDPRDFVLFTYGGAGPMHAAEVARTLSISTALVPPAPGLFSAFGLLMCDVRHDFVHSRFTAVEDLRPDEYESIFQAMEQLGRERLALDGFTPDRVVLQRTADVRYQGQWFELNLPMPDGQASLEDIDARFRKAHLDRYRVDMERPTEFVNFRVAAIGRTDKPHFARSQVSGSRPASARSREMIFDERPWDTTVYRRSALPAGFDFAGPAAIEEAGATTIIPPGCSGRIDDSGTIVISVS